ncbi:tryptophan synthase subunit alpha [Balneolaceae bacterium ANBcel3]|nr:tryptophan synthase subunit alpha [Balneolaceae bacterium ANBcel3]
MSRIASLFASKDKDKKIVSLFVTAGFPDPSSTAPLILELEKSGADMIELGMPFSDPLADGPTVQYASKVALDHGVNLDTIFDMVREIRASSSIPIVLMGYINPVLRYGLKRFFEKAGEAGVDGIILPDVPPGELDGVDELCAQYRIDPIYLVAPNTSDERMRIIDSKGKGFIYCVSVTGVTGTRDGSEISASIDSFINRVQANVTKNPVLIGFGIKNHEDARLIAKKSDGYIVGSALIDYIRSVYPEKDWLKKTGQFVHELKFGKQQ